MRRLQKVAKDLSSPARLAARAHRDAVAGGLRSRVAVDARLRLAHALLGALSLPTMRPWQCQSGGIEWTGRIRLS